MNYLATFSDKDIFPHKERIFVTEWTLRKTVKIVIKNTEGKIALITNPIHNCFLLPGGGVDENEEIFAAANRESKEEAMCSIVDPEILGVVEEYHARDGKRYETHGIFARAGKSMSEDLRTSEEKKNNLTVVWLTMQEIEEKFKQQEILLRNGKIDFYNTGFNIIRDQVFLNTAKESGLV